MLNNWGDPLKHAAWLVLCDDDVPEDVVRVRCEAANTIKKLWDENRRLRGEVKQLAEADGLPTAAARYVHAINTIADLRAALHITADGVPVEEGKPYYFPCANGVLEFFAYLGPQGSAVSPYPWGKGYSTRRAAEAAKEVNDGSS